MMNTPPSEADIEQIVFRMLQRPGIVPTQGAFAGGQGDAVATGIPVSGHYASREYDNGSQTGVFTIDWTKSNVQYITVAGSTTFVFAGALTGGRYVLQVAGAYTPTFPANVRWSGGVAPAGTATAGKKDIYTFIYSGKEQLYNGLQSSNFATT